MNYNRLHFSLAFMPESADSIQAWRLLVDYLKRNNTLPKKFNMSQIMGYPEHLQSETRLVLTPQEVEQTILDRCLPAFHVEAGTWEKRVTFSFGYGEMGTQIDDKAKAPNEWSEFIESNLNLSAGIGGWQIFWFYRTWQGLPWVLAYNTPKYGVKPPGLRTKSESFDPETEYIDNSLNPGRSKMLTSKAVFYPTAEMWLGPHFWQYAKCTKEQALEADFWLETRDTPHYTYFKCWPQYFTRPDGEQGRMQQRLWKLFFDEDCEWPPGSCSICDEPMYGPPELMP